MSSAERGAHLRVVDGPAQGFPGGYPYPQHLGSETRRVANGAAKPHRIRRGIVFAGGAIEDIDHDSRIESETLLAHNAWAAATSPAAETWLFSAFIV